MFIKNDKKRSIWIVDDSASDAERVLRVLSGEYDVTVFKDGAAALEGLSSGEIPDLLLVDWVMPGISGIEVCQYVRSAPGKLPHMPIILLTAQHGTEEIVHAFESGANDYVSKPFVDAELKARVKTLIESKKLLERAETAEADVRLLLVNAPDPIFVVNAGGIVTFANEEASLVIGKDNPSIVGSLFSSIIPDFNLMTAPLKTNLPMPDVQIGERMFSPSFRLLPSDTKLSTTISLRDVTNRRRDEARRLDFYSVIAHDLRTPITSILMRIQMAFRGKHGVLPPTLTTDLRRIEGSLRSQVGMVNDFLELARLEGVGYKIERQPVQISDLITATMDDFQPLMEKNGIKWEHKTSPNPETALGDRQRLSQVLANLVGNAIKFTPKEGVITTSIIHSNDDIETSISDTGRGIATEELPHLFERFTRARASENETPGTGLGLMIVREIVEAHGGTLGVESTPGVGSRFWFRLPRFAPQTATN